MPQNTKIHFYLVQIYIIELSINGNVNNINLWSRYTVTRTSIKEEKILMSIPTWNSENNNLYLGWVYHFMKWNIYIN